MNQILRSREIGNDPQLKKLLIVKTDSPCQHFAKCINAHGCIRMNILWWTFNDAPILKNQTKEIFSPLFTGLLRIFCVFQKHLSAKMFIFCEKLCVCNFFPCICCFCQTKQMKTTVQVRHTKLSVSFLKRTETLSLISYCTCRSMKLNVLY